MSPIKREFWNDSALDKLTFEFYFEYTPAGPMQFCNGHGNYLPGDEAQIEITDIYLYTKDLPGCDGVKLEGTFYEKILAKFQDEVKKDAWKQIERAA